MSIWGKITGVAAGLLLGGPIGALLGGIAGHVYDQQRKEAAEGGYRLPPGVEPPPPPPPGFDPLEAKRIAFASAVVVLSAKMAKVDGRVTRDEIKAFKEHFDIRADELGDVGRLFNEARREATGFEPYAEQVAMLFAYEPAVLEEILDGLFIVAAADGELHDAERAFLEEVARIFGFGPAEIMAIRARFEAGRRQQQRRQEQGRAAPSAETSPYAVLGLESTADEATIRQRYRELVREHHPDRLTAKGMPEEFVRQANEKLAAINAAYDVIAKQRGMR